MASVAQELWDLLKAQPDRSFTVWEAWTFGGPASRATPGPRIRRLLDAFVAQGGAEVVAVPSGLPSTDTKSRGGRIAYRYRAPGGPTSPARGAV